MATFTISSDDSLYTVPLTWESLFTYIQDPRQLLARERVMGEARHIVRFEYGRVQGFRGDVLLQGVERKVYQTAYVKATKGGALALSAEAIDAINGAVVETVDVSLRPDCRLAFTHIKINPESLSNPWFQWLMAQNPRQVVDYIWDNFPKRLKKIPSASFEKPRDTELQRNPRHLANPRLPSAPYVLEVGTGSTRGCCTCAIVVSPYQVVGPNTRTPRFVLTDAQYAFTTYCPCVAELSPAPLTLIKG